MFSSNVLKRWSFQKVSLEHDLFSNIWRVGVSLFPKIYSFFKPKIQDDLSPKIHGKIIFLYICKNVTNVILPVQRCSNRCFKKFCKTHRKTTLKETLVQVFSCEFYEISKNTFFTEHPWTTASALLPKKAKIIFSRKSTLKGDISGITEKDDIYPIRYGIITVEIPYRFTF